VGDTAIEFSNEGSSSLPKQPERGAARNIPTKRMAMLLRTRILLATRSSFFNLHNRGLIKNGHLYQLLLTHLIESFMWVQGKDNIEKNGN
jgi:hypothetical protein